MKKKKKKTYGVIPECRSKSQAEFRARSQVCEKKEEKDLMVGNKKKENNVSLLSGGEQSFFCSVSDSSEEKLRDGFHVKGNTERQGMESGA